MKSVSLSGSLRENVGKEDAKKSRKEGNVPCVIYGGKEQVHFQMDERQFKDIVFTAEVFIIDIEINGKTYKTILQDIQYHPVTDRILHADFLEVVPEKPVKIGIPVKLKGTAPGIIKGGKLFKNMRKLLVKGLVEDLPEFFEIDISSLEINDSVVIRDLSFDKLELLDVPSEVVVAVRTTRVAAADEVEEEEEEGEGEGAEGGEGSSEEKSE